MTNGTMTDSEKLRLAASWLDSSGEWSPEQDEVRLDLLRIASELEEWQPIAKICAKGHVALDNERDDVCQWCRLLDVAKRCTEYSSVLGLSDAIRKIDPEWEG